MKMQLIAFTCVLGLVACGGTENKPANDSSSAQTTGAMDNNNASRTTTSSPETMTNTTTPAAETAPSPNPNALNQPSASGTMPSTNGNSGSMQNGTTGTGTWGNGGTGATGTTSTGTMGSTGSTPTTGTTTTTPAPATANDQGPTAMDQGGSDAERNITAQIRKQIVADSSMSFAAKNVKIITQGSKVTLRGSVKTDAEKKNIEMVAKQTAGVTQVDNKLEVKK